MSELIGIDGMDDKQILKYLNRKIDGRFSKKIVIFIILINIIFTLAVMYLFLKTGSEPVALVVAWFAFTTVELWSLASIKKNKEDNETKEDC